VESEDVKPPQLKEYPKKLERISDHASPLDQLFEESYGRKSEALCMNIMAHVCLSIVFLHTYSINNST
jgi:hypothetical protein